MLDCSCDRLRAAEKKAAKWDEVVKCGECAFWGGLDTRPKMAECHIWSEEMSGFTVFTGDENFCSRGEKGEA